MADDSNTLQPSLYHRQEDQTEHQQEEQGHESRESEEDYEGLYDTQSFNSSTLPPPPFDYNYVASPISLSETYSNSGCNTVYADSDDDMNFVTNLFEHRRDYVADDYQSSDFSDSPFVWRNEMVGARVLGSDHEAEEVQELGFGNEIDRLGSGLSGLRVAGIDSESDTEDEMDEVGEIRFDGQEIRWEGVNGEEIPLEEDGGNYSGNDREAGLRDLAWEVFRAANNYNMDFDQDTTGGVTYITVHDGYITTEYHPSGARFVETESDFKGSPPAAKSVVENLDSVVLTQEYVEDNNVVCAVCKDELSVEEVATRLPCRHHYHGECIVPWLNIRNTCPVCRFELPTDDADYERMKGRSMVLWAG